MELIEDNNSFAGYRMGVGSRADFLITSVTGPASAQSGQSITTQVTVCNQGTQPDSSEVEVYLSADSTIRANAPPGPLEDSFVGSAPTGYLNPGQCSTVSVSGNAYMPPPGFEGAYYVGAVVDPYNSRTELLEDNNAKAGYRMGMGNRPDFIVTSVTGPASTQSGKAITTQVTVCNQGTQPDSSDVAVYLSADSTIRANVPPGSPEDSFVGSAPTGYLNPGQCSTVPVSGNAYLPPPGTEGPYYVGAVVDPYSSRTELIEDNNTKAGYRIGVGYKADFLITAVTGPYSVKPGTAFTVNTTVCNRGQRTDTTDVELYLSADSTIRVPTPPQPPEDFYLGVLTGLSLSPGACTTRALSVTAPSVPDGGYVLGAVADPYNSRAELIEDNNALAGNSIGVGYKADFVITGVSGPYSVKPGNTFSVTATVCNRGQSTDTTDVELYLSADTNVRRPTPPQPPEDFYLGVITGISLSPGTCANRSLSVTAPSVPDDAYYLGAVADPYNQRTEFFEDNNAKAGNRIGVGYRPDFVITALTGPSSVVKGASFSATLTVCNRGQLSSMTDVEFYFSANTTIRVPSPTQPPEDYYLGVLPGVNLAPGACSSHTVTLTANAPTPASYYLGAVADPYNQRTEFLEDNNTRAGTYMSVTP
jgi:subtilase family serine protease